MQDTKKAPHMAPLLLGDEAMGSDSVVAQNEGQSVVAASHNHNLGVVAFRNFFGGFNPFPFQEFVAQPL